MALCEMVPLLDSQCIATNVHPMTARSKCISPRRPGHFSPAYRKMPGSSAGTQTSEISITSRDEYAKALESSEEGRNPIDSLPITHRQPEARNLHNIFLFVLGNRNQFISVPTISPCQRQQNTALNTSHKAHCCYKCHGALQRAPA